MGSEDIGLNKIFRPNDGSVDMGFSRKMNDRVWPVFSQQSVDQLGIVNITLDKNMAAIAQKPCKILQIPGIRQFVEIDDGMVEPLQTVENEIWADKPGSSSDQKNFPDQNPAPV